MNLRLYTACAFFTLCISFSYAQEEVKNDSLLRIEQAEQAKMLQAEIEKAEREAKKAEKEAKKAEKALKKKEKAAKKREDLKDKIVDKKKDIAKRERKINDLQEDMELDKIKGKLSPNDIDKIDRKIEKERLRTIKDKEKLRKLELQLKRS